MYIPEKMKVNKFQEVAIPSNKSFFARLGNVDPNTLKYSGDDVVPEPMSKVDNLVDYELYAAEMAKKESEK